MPLCDNPSSQSSRSRQNYGKQMQSYSSAIGLQWNDELPMDNPNDLAGYSQPLLRSENRLS